MEEDGECGKCMRADHIFWGTALCKSSAVTGKCICYQST